MFVMYFRYTFVFVIVCEGRRMGGREEGRGGRGRGRGRERESERQHTVDESNFREAKISQFYMSFRCDQQTAYKKKQTFKIKTV